MIAANTDPSLSFPAVGNDTFSEASFAFPLYASENLEAYVKDAADVKTVLVLGVDYSLSGVGKLVGGGSVKLIDAAQAWINGGNLKTGYTLYVNYVSKVKQLARFRDLGPHAPVEFERALDKLTMDMIKLLDDDNFYGPLAATFLETAFTPSTLQVLDAGDSITIENLHRQHVRIVSSGGQLALSATPFGVDTTKFRDGMEIVVECVSGVDRLSFAENDNDYGYIGNGGIISNNRRVLTFVYSGYQKRFLIKSLGVW